MKDEIVLYQPNEQFQLEVQLKDETVWLTQDQIAILFGTQRPAITKHLNNIYNSGELDFEGTCSILERMGNDGKQRYQTKYYNLDAILSVGYRVSSKNATLFRRWATKNPTLACISSVNFPWPNPKYPKADKLFKWPKENAFGEMPTKPEAVPYELCVQKCIDGAAELPNGNEYFELVKDADSRRSINEGDTKRRSFKRLHRYRYSPTTCFGNNEVFLHPYENRRLTVREAIRIQGVDDKYTLGADRLSAKFKIISNGVPVNLANAVADSVYAFVEKVIPEDER